MTINRRTKFRPGSLDASIVKDNTGLLIEEDTGKLSAQPLVDEDLVLHQRINDLYWKDPLEVFDNITAPEDYRVGDTFYIKEAQQIYIYGGVQITIPEGVDVYQPQSWIDANRQEVFFPIAVGLDKDSLATKAYVNSEILHLIDGAPQLLDTLNELAAAINDNPNFATDILNITTFLQNTKANKDDVYTKTEVNNKDDAIYDYVDTLNAQARRVPDYVVGAGAYADDNNIQELLNAIDLTELSEFKTIYLRKGTEFPVVTNILAPSLVFTSFDKNIIKLNQININTQEALEDSPSIISFSNISANKLTIASTTAQVEVFIKSCQFDRIDILSSNAIVHIEDSLLNKVIVNNSVLHIKNSILDSLDNVELLNIAGSSKVNIFTSKLRGRTFIADTAKLYLNKNELFNIENNPYLIVNSLTSLLSLENNSFFSDSSFATYHVDGIGQLYANLNNYDRRLNSALDSDSSYTTKITVQPLLNNGAGLPVQNYYLPVGYGDFFYNDERARDTIAEMLQVQPGIVKNYDDINNTLTLGLNISTANLSDEASIAYKDRVNSFTKANTFAATLTANAGIYTNSISASFGTISNLKSTTASLSDNSNKVATTAFVQAKYAQLEFDLQDLELNELRDVDIISPQEKHYLTYIPTSTLTGITINAHWANRTIDSFDLTDSGTLVRVGNSVFVLADIGRPALLDQSGAAVGPMDAWPSTSQILRWSGQQYDIAGTLTKGSGQWISDFANNPILRATEEPLGAAGYDGWGKIALADFEEVRDGSNSTKAVVPSLLNTYYASITLSNLNSAQIQAARENIGFPATGEQDHYLIWNNGKWENIDVAKPTYYKVTSSSAAITGARGYFYNVIATSLTTFTMPTTEQGDLIVRKDNSAGTIKFTSAVGFLTSDNQLVAEFDIVSEGHLIEFKYISHNGSNVWLAQGYYQSSSSGVIDTEFIQDAAAALFEHQDHAPAIDLEYDDPAHKILLNINYATNAQAIAGTVNNLPVTPAGLKAALDASVPEGVLFAANNLSDLQSATTARTNLGLGSAALVNVGNTTSSLIQLASALEAGKAVLFNGTGLVSGDPPSQEATENTPGLVTIGSSTDSPTSTNVITINLLNTLLNNNSSWLVNLISNISGGGSSLTYTPINNQAFTASPSTYYSLSTPNGNIVITLPAISTLNFGNRIEFKFTTKFPNTTITINRSASDTIDKTYTEIELVEEGQHIALIAGINNNWEIA